MGKSKLNASSEGVLKNCCMCGGVCLILIKQAVTEMALSELTECLHSMALAPFRTSEEVDHR